MVRRRRRVVPVVRCGGRANPPCRPDCPLAARVSPVGRGSSPAKRRLEVAEADERKTALCNTAHEVLPELSRERPVIVVNLNLVPAGHTSVATHASIGMSSEMPMNGHHQLVP